MSARFRLLLARPHLRCAFRRPVFVKRFAGFLAGSCISVTSVGSASDASSDTGSTLSGRSRVSRSNDPDVDPGSDWNSLSFVSLSEWSYRWHMSSDTISGEIWSKGSSKLCRYCSIRRFLRNWRRSSSLRNASSYAAFLSYTAVFLALRKAKVNVRKNIYYLFSYYLYICGNDLIIESYRKKHRVGILFTMSLQFTSVTSKECMPQGFDIKLKNYIC